MAYGFESFNDSGRILVSDSFTHLGLAAEQVNSPPTSGQSFSYDVNLPELSGTSIHSLVPVLKNGLLRQTRLYYRPNPTRLRYIRYTAIPFGSASVTSRIFARDMIKLSAEPTDYGLQLYNESGEKSFSSNFNQLRMRYLDTGSTNNPWTWTLGSGTRPSGWIDYTTQIRSATGNNDLYAIAFNTGDSNLNWVNYGMCSPNHTAKISGSAAGFGGGYIGMHGSYFVVAADSSNFSTSISNQRIRFYGAVVAAYD